MSTASQIANLEPSSGSFRALQYAHTYPDSVGRFILDAVVPHGVVSSRSLKFQSEFQADHIPQGRKEQAKDIIIGANRALLRADAYCQNNASCPLINEGKGIIPRVRTRPLAEDTIE